MLKKTLTSRQAEALEFIKSFISTNNYPPTVREIADHMGHLSSSTAFNILNRLAQKGYITKSDKSVRAIQVVNDGHVSTDPINLQATSNMLIEIQTCKCPSCQRKFYELEDHEVHNCAHCGQELTFEPDHELLPDHYYLIIDPKTGIPMIKTSTDLGLREGRRA